MKKLKYLCLLLCLSVLLQCMTLPAMAEETTENPETEATTEATEPYIPMDAIPEVEFGSASITNGCRTINGMTPLAGSERMLETAQSAFVYEANTQTVIYSYNADVRMSPGTLAKMVTGLIAIENCDMDQVITCSTRWNSSLPAGVRNAEIKEGEELTMYDLVCCLLIGSHNDAALIIANNVAESEAAFVEMMNRRVAEIGCTDTKFTNCTGLDNDEHYTTARDMAKITQEAFKNEIFQEISAITYYTFGPNERRDKEAEISTDNYLISQMVLPQFYQTSVKGGMASYSEISGAGLTFVSESNNMRLIAVTLGGERTYESNGWQVKYYGNFEEALTILEFVYGGYRICRIIYPDMALGQFPVLGGECDVIGQPDIAVNTVLPAKAQLDNLNFRYTIEGGGLKAPVEKGEKIGTVQVWYRTSCVTESEVFAMNPVRSAINSGITISNAASRDDSNLSGILNFLGIVCLLILLPLGGYLAINGMRRYLAQRKRRRRRASRRRSR